MTPSRAVGGALLVALLLSTLAAPLAAAQSVRNDVFTVLDIRFTDPETLVITVQNAESFPQRGGMTAITASLLEGGALVAMPERTYAKWAPGEIKELEYTLVRNTSSGTLKLKYTVPGGDAAEQSIALMFPRYVDPNGGTAARVTPVDATVWDNRTANFTLKNTGTAATGALRASVEDGSGVRIGVPFEQQIGTLAPGAFANLSFDLARGAQQVTLVLEYANRTEQHRLQLRVVDGNSESGGDGEPEGPLTLRTDLPFMESEPGRTVNYNLRLGNEGKGRLAELGVAGLPAGWTARFYVSGTGVPSFFLPSGQSRDVTLSITIPATSARQVGETLDFAAVVTVDGSEEARADLILTLRGRGKLEVEGENWFSSVNPGEWREINVTVRNTGTAALHDVRLDASRPSGWQVRFEPATISRIEAGESKSVLVKVKAPEDVGTGKYVLDISAANAESQARARSLSIDVAQPESSSLGWILGAAFAAVVAVVLIVKLRRR